MIYSRVGVTPSPPVKNCSMLIPTTCAKRGVNVKPSIMKQNKMRNWTLKHLGKVRDGGFHTCDCIFFSHAGNVGSSCGLGRYSRSSGLSRIPACVDNSWSWLQGTGVGQDWKTVMYGYHAITNFIGQSFVCFQCDRLPVQKLFLRLHFIQRIPLVNMQTLAGECKRIFNRGFLC